MPYAPEPASRSTPRCRIRPAGRYLGRTAVAPDRRAPTMVQVGEIGEPPERVLDIWGLDELRHRGRARRPRARSADDLHRDPALPTGRRVPAGARGAATTIGAAQIQNRGTIGGNVANASPAGDTLPILLACGAEIVLGSPAASRSVTADDFPAIARPRGAPMSSCSVSGSRWCRPAGPLPEDRDPPRAGDQQGRDGPRMAGR